MKKFFKRILLGLVVYWALTFLIRLSQVVRNPEVLCEDSMEVINEGDDRHHQRAWQSISSRQYYCANYQTTGEQNVAGAIVRDEMPAKLGQYDYLWSRVYEVLAEDGVGQLDFLVDSIQNISASKGLSTIELAELVVTFVQDIPYRYVIPSDCDAYETNGTPCVGRIPYGILSPYEFLHTLYGDCDTRAVLIYALLKQLKYNVSIVVSDEYRHAMIAINLPAAGDYLIHQGRRYYFWETTATGWQMGLLPPSYNNKDYWKIALVNEL